MCVNEVGNIVCAYVIETTRFLVGHIFLKIILIKNINPLFPTLFNENFQAFKINYFSTAVALSISVLNDLRASLTRIMPFSASAQLRCSMASRIIGSVFTP